MSADNILKIPECEFEERADKIFVQTSRPYILNAKYMVGCKPDLQKLNDLQRILDISKYDDCLLEEGDRELINCEIKKIINELQK